MVDRTEDERLDNLERDERLERLEKWSDEMKKLFADAFPGGDHVGHCRYHDLMIEHIEERRKLRAAVVEKTIAGLVWGMLAGLAIAVWQYVKAQILKGG